MDDNVKEIDLFVVIQKIAKYFLRNKIVLLIFIFAGIGIAFFRIKENPNKYINYYSTEFYIESTTISNEMLHTLVDNLNFEYNKLPETKFDPQLLSQIIKIDASKELSIDGLRSNVKVEVRTRSPLDLDFIIRLASYHIELSDYFMNKTNLRKEDIEQVLNLLNNEFDSLGINAEDANLSQILRGLSANNPHNYLAYIGLVEKKVALDRELSNLSVSLKFVPIEPDNKLVSTARLQLLTYLGYSLLMLVIGFFVLKIKDFIKKN